MNRRGFLLGALATPFVIKTPSILMPVKSIEIVVGGTIDEMNWLPCAEWTRLGAEVADLTNYEVLSASMRPGFMRRVINGNIGTLVETRLINVED